MYSASPTTPTMRTGSPLVREASPPHTSKSGEPVPTQSSYGTLSLLPMHSAISPLTDSSFSFGQEAKSHERSQSANDQTMAPVVIRRDFERGNRNFHPLSNEVYPDTEGAKSSSYPPPFSSQIEKESDVKASTLPSKAAHGHKNETDQPHHASTFAEDESKHDQNEAREPASVSDKDIDWDINTAHALMIAAQESLKQSERPSSPAVSELEAPLPSSHPLLLEARHTQFSSNATPSTAPRNFLRDLPLRHYHSQEQFHSPGFSASRENEPTSKLRRSSSVLQRGSTQLSPDTVKVLNNTLPPNSSLSPAPIQSSSTPSPLRVVTDMNSTQIESSNLNQSTKPSPGRDVISERSSNSVPEQHPPFLAPTRSLTPIIAENINASANPVNSPTKPKKLSPTSPTHKPLTSSQEPDLCPAAKYKTSAENNVPFYLNPVSSTALADFLSPTHRSSSPHPGAQVCPNSGNPGHPPFTFEENTRVEDSPSPNSAAPAPIVAGAPIPPAPGVHSRIGTRSFSPPAEAASSTPPSPVAEKKHKWKNVFGSRGAARQKSAKTGPKVVIVGKGEWYKIERKKKGQKDSKDLKDVKDLNGPGESPSTAEAGFMGVGKDGVWISRKNFVKT